MDLLAGLFGLILVVLSVGVTYRYGIKPDRDEKKRRAEQGLAELRRQQVERSRNRRPRLS